MEHIQGKGSPGSIAVRVVAVDEVLAFTAEGFNKSLHSLPFLQSSAFASWFLGVKARILDFGQGGDDLFDVSNHTDEHLVVVEGRVGTVQYLLPQCHVIVPHKGKPAVHRLQDRERKPSALIVEVSVEINNAHP
jgi:hypothetical protein